MEQNWYIVLGLNPNATDEEIRDKYMTLVKNIIQMQILENQKVK